MAKIKGICKNIDECTKALNREVQEVEKGAKFICHDCEKPLVEVDNKKEGGSKLRLIAISVAAVAVLSIVGGYYMNKDGAKPEETPLDPKVVDTTITAIATIVVSETNIELLVGASHPINLQLTPADAKGDELKWTVADEKIATVNNGIVTAVAEGQTRLSINDPKGAATATCQIVVKEQQTPPGVSSGQIDYGKWTGGSKNGKPHGTQITFTFTSSHQIDSRDPKNRVANVGDYVIGEYINGNLVQGRWYKKSGGFESVMIGKGMGM